LKAAEAIIKYLEKEKVDIVFGYPGAAVIPIYEELSKSSIKHVLVRHEQAAGHSASGYARSTGKVGVCIVTSGPGATNIITAIATAYMDSIPLVVITGQVNTSSIGKDVFQEVDITGSTEPFTKHNYLVKDVESIPKVIKEAFYIASTGRPGPVLIDIPEDLQNKSLDKPYPEKVNIRGYKPSVGGHKLQIKRAVEKILNSKRPLICAGGGIDCSKAVEEFRQFVEKSGIPVVHTLMGKNSLETTSPYCLGLIGSHGFSYTNRALLKADLLIFIGCRIADRASSALKHIDPRVPIIHIDIDPAEIGKNLNPTIPVVGDAKLVLQEMLPQIENINAKDWVDELNLLKNTELSSKHTDFSHNYVNPKHVFNCISNMDDDDLILVSDVGQNQIWSARNFSIIKERRFLTSGGFGTMGYSLPAAIGAKLACPNKRIIATMGDGSFQMSLFELGTLIENEVDITLIIFNNSGLGMVREIQRRLYNNCFGVEINSNPDFVKLAEAYGIKGKRASTNEEFEEIFNESMKNTGATLIECIVDPQLKTLI
jgi:acetolactate synthase I/II/III large subunit